MNQRKDIKEIIKDAKLGKIIKDGIKVAIVGKPNVGKSTFFNYIVGKRLSIVEDIPGVTRDRVYADSNWRGRDFTLIDTAGIEPESKDVILFGMREQANIAINMAEV